MDKTQVVHLVNLKLKTAYMAWGQPHYSTPLSTFTNTGNDQQHNRTPVVNILATLILKG